MKTFSKLAIVAMLIFGGIAFTACKHHPPSFDKIAEFVTKRLTKELDLNENQKTILEKLKNEVLAKRKELQVHGPGFMPKEMVEEIRKDKIDEAKAIKHFESESAKHVAFRSFILKKFTEFHASLTPEQRNKLADLIQKMQNKFHHD